MNLDDFSTVVDDRRYINPQVSLDEQNAFINNLRSTQGARTAEIATDTYNLGTAVPSNLGGLSGAGSYFASRYQTPQTNALVADLKMAAQAQALGEAMNNELAQAKQRYNNAYKAYQKRHGGNNPASPTNPDNPADPDKLNVNTNSGSKDWLYVNTNTNTGPGKLDFINGNTVYTDNDGSTYTLRNLNAGERSSWNAPSNVSSGSIVEKNGIKYLYLDNAQSGGAKWYAISGE